MGDWSMLMTLSKYSIPSMPSCFPARVLARLSWAARDLYKISFTREDFPDPDTPVTAMKVPRGNATSTPRRLFSLAPRTTRELPLPLRLSVGTGMNRRRAR